MNYLQHIPRTINYIANISPRYDECLAFCHFLDEKIFPALEKGYCMRAMILAAGRGERIGELTKTTPKPLLKINGKYLIDYSIESLANLGVQDIVINICFQKRKDKKTR